ncbi:N-acetylmuramoyl-L-alanine amidase [Kaistella sp. PBT33-4]|uniref:SH3 domain-containing protein n=1 Tax=Kaistella sp. PBT33-4 TaxID=3032000 RepID=UPI0023D89B83|nr:SH3 domain-containing protein [Kaistella sp. PBT33-4]MDF0720569.1 N-acetylmuramoyl-L-alanine amidase [Kaistella sp. PBT33-4]
METKYGFTKFSLEEFKKWIAEKRIARTITKIQHHHTYSPSYIHFKSNNHFDLQNAMKNHHINSNGWGNIGQHFTIFPDGSIVTGRNIETTPACIYGQNAGSVCIESLGNFDKGKDSMTAKQVASIVECTALLCSKFNLPATTDFVIYHHWYNLASGERNNGTKNNKSCPGTAFFGGNKVSDCNNNFIPLIKAAIKEKSNLNSSLTIGYASVTASALNVRTEPNAQSTIDKQVPKVMKGSILRVYERNSGWIKISGSREAWVAERYTVAVQKAIVTGSILNIRSGPGTQYMITGKLHQNEIIFTDEKDGDWLKLAMEQKWVHTQYLNCEPIDK